MIAMSYRTKKKPEKNDPFGVVNFFLLKIVKNNIVLLYIIHAMQHDNLTHVYIS